MMEHMSFWQQFAMALAHGGPPTVTALVTGIVAYTKLRRRQDARHEQIVVMLNGRLENTIQQAVKKAME